jgi:hypothetical protein
MRIPISAILFLFYGLTIHAQEPVLEPGFLVMPNSDTIDGFVHRFRDATLSKQVVFQESEQQQTNKTYSPFEVKGFGLINGGIYFESVKYTKWVESNNQVETRFGKLMLDGGASLYEVVILEEEKSKIKVNMTELDRAYILKKDTAWYTLDQYVIQDDRTGMFRVIPRYKGMLTLVMQDCPKYLDNVHKLVFNEKEIIGLVQKYNKCRFPAQSVSIKNYKAKSKWRIGLDAAFVKVVNKKEFKVDKGWSIDILASKYNIGQHERAWATFGLGIMALDLDKEGIEFPKAIIRLPIMVNIYSQKKSFWKPFAHFGATPTSKWLFLNIGTGIEYKQFLAGLMFEASIFYTNKIRLLSFRAGMLLRPVYGE